MVGMLLAEGTVFGNGEPVRIVTLIFVAVVISALALCAFDGDLKPC